MDVFGSTSVKKAQAPAQLSHNPIQLDGRCALQRLWPSHRPAPTQRPARLARASLSARPGSMTSAINGRLISSTARPSTLGAHPARRFGIDSLCFLIITLFTTCGSPPNTSESQTSERDFPRRDHIFSRRALSSFFPPIHNHPQKNQLAPFRTSHAILRESLLSNGEQRAELSAGRKPLFRGEPRSRPSFVGAHDPSTAFRSPQGRYQGTRIAK